MLHSTFHCLCMPVPGHACSKGTHIYYVQFYCMPMQQDSTYVLPPCHCACGTVTAAVHIATLVHWLPLPVPALPATHAVAVASFCILYSHWLVLQPAFTHSGLTVHAVYILLAAHFYGCMPPVTAALTRTCSSTDSSPSSHGLQKAATFYQTPTLHTHTAHCLVVQLFFVLTPCLLPASRNILEKHPSTAIFLQFHSAIAAWACSHPSFSCLIIGWFRFRLHPVQTPSHTGCLHWDHLAMALLSSPPATVPTATGCFCLRLPFSRGWTRVGDMGRAVEERTRTRGGSSCDRWNGESGASVYWCALLASYLPRCCYRCLPGWCDF